MTTTVASTAIEKEIPPNSTTSLPSNTPIEEKLKSFESIDYLLKPNRSIADQINRTQLDHFNGESSTVNINLGEAMLTPPFLPQLYEYFNVKQKWEGYVLEVGEETFLARLVPITGEGGDLEAEIYLEEVDLADRSLVQAGAIFYWSIGYLKRPSGTYRASLIRFRRLPPRTKSDIEAARAEANKLIGLFNGE